MKKSVKSLLTLLLLLGVTLEMKAADVYLLTAQTINGIVGKYAVPSNHKFDPNTSYGSNVYSLKITSMPEGGFWFRIGVSGESNQMQPKVNDAPLTINDEGAQDPTSYSIESGCYGSSNAWKVSYTADQSLVGSATLAENGNYWELETRNDKVTDDDGMYTFSFTLDGDGNPCDWQVKHDATTRVSYILGDMEGATAQPLFDKRESGGNTGRYTDNNVASLYFNGRNKYWCIGYVVNNVNSENATEQYEQAIKATPDIHVTASVNANHDDNSGTHDKLFFLGNGGYPYNTNDNRNKVRPNQKPFTLNLYGIKRVQFNANKGDNELAKLDDSYGMSAEIELKGDNNKADFSITTMSMIGDAVEGTYDAKTGNWNYTSKAGDMEYDANERCFSLTISTEDEKYNNSHYFRFVANHKAEQNWGETEDNVTTNTGLARSRYDGADDVHHTCMAGDANDVQYRTTARGETEAASEIRTDILWNRPAGNWRIKFYPGLDKDGKDVSYYTISGTKVVKMPFTYRVRRFIRTYSNSVAMKPAKDNVKVYAAYKYEPPKEVKDCYSEGKVYLRELEYIPANMGVVLVGEVPADKQPAGGYEDGAKVNFYLEETNDLDPDNNYEALWIKKDQYAGDKWNNYLKPTVES